MEVHRVLNPSAHNLAEPMQCVKEGWLEKWTNFLNSWRLRYVVMQQESCLLYGHSKEGPFKEISLKEATIQLHHGDSLRIDILTKEHGSLFLKAKTIENRNLWYFAFKQSLNEAVGWIGENSNAVLTNTLPPPDTQAMASDSSATSDVYKDASGWRPSLLNSLQKNEKLTTFEKKGRSYASDSKDTAVAFFSSSLSDEMLNPRTSVSSDIVDRATSPFLDGVEGDHEKSSLKCLSENLSACKQHVVLAFKRIRRMQSELVKDVGKLYSQQIVVDPSLKNNVVQLLQQIDLVDSIMQCHFASSETFVADEKLERKQLEKSLQWFAKQCYGYEQLLLEKRESDEVRNNVLSEVAGLTKRDASESELYNEDQSDMNSLEFFDCDEADQNVTFQSLSQDYTNALEPLNKDETRIDTFSSSTLKNDLLALDGYVQTMEGYRTKLPVSRRKMNVSVWSVLKDFVGKELSRISMPVGWNEPTCFLQRIAEDFQYEHLLRRAVDVESSAERLAWVSVFVASPYASACGRTYKPFNPLLGETFDMSHRGFFYLAEQVEHHPPVTAYHVESDAYVSWGHLLIKTSLTRGSLKVSMPGPIHLIFPSSTDGDHYVYQRADILVHNIIMGNLWIEIDGTIIIRNLSTQDYAAIEFLPKGWIKGRRHRIRGVIFDSSNTAHYYISGIWSVEIFMTKLDTNKKFLFASVVEKEGKEATRHDPNGTVNREGEQLENVLKRINWSALENNGNNPKLVWRVAERPPDSDDFYGFSYFTMELNQLVESNILPSTDTRFRPDQRAYEDGKIEVAKSEKLRLEEKQRAAARLRKKENAEYKPQWFEKSVDRVTNESAWIYKGNYWESKKQGYFENTRSLF